MDIGASTHVTAVITAVVDKIYILFFLFKLFAVSDSNIVCTSFPNYSSYPSCLNISMSSAMLVPVVVNISPVMAALAPDWNNLAPQKALRITSAPEHNSSLTTNFYTDFARI